MLNQRLSSENRRIIPEFSFGGDYSEFLDIYENSIGMGDYNALRIRKGSKSITISNETPEPDKLRAKGLLSEHKDKPGVISSLFNSLASEGINVETAQLKSNDDGTAVAFLTLSGANGNVKEAMEFIKGTDVDLFDKLTFGEDVEVPNYYRDGKYLLEVDGVELKLALTKKLILTKHNNNPGVLLILLSALASKNINIIDLRLGKRNKKGYSALAVEGDEHEISHLLEKLGPQFEEANMIVFNSK